MITQNRGGRRTVFGGETLLRLPRPSRSLHCENSSLPRAPRPDSSEEWIRRAPPVALRIRLIFHRQPHRGWRFCFFTFKYEISIMNNSLHTVYVGLSGGVDSSVAAALLKQQGYHVVGAYMKNWTRDIAGHTCPWEDDLKSAKSVAAHLGIELKVYDLQLEYRAAVVDAMVAAYQSGETPNPDVLCNELIKFQLFFDLCMADGADYVATGHYARIDGGVLKMAVDDRKDQTYFLYRLPEAAAHRVLFPIGDYHKPAVREMATELGLPTARRKDSMGLCFVGRVPLKDFLSEFMELHPGAILDADDRVIGQHEGVELFTIGQRHGLGIGGGSPYYVLSKDIPSATVRVTTDPSVLERDHYTIDRCRWWTQPDEVTEYHVRIRHLGELLPCRLQDLGDGSWRIQLAGNHRGVAIGQHAVVYLGETVIGGGALSS